MESKEIDREEVITIAKWINWLLKIGLDLHESVYVCMWVKKGLSLEEAIDDVMNLRTLKKEEEIDWGNPITP